jgi:SAM-dependent methyltransferase
MGLARGAARLLLNECSQRPFSGAVLQLGRQDLYFTMQELEKWASQHGVELRSADHVETPGRVSKAAMAMGVIDDQMAFTSMGFECVESCDLSDYENPDHLLDLNVPVPVSLHDRYDLIIDGGTLEHIFNTPNVLENIYRMLKTGGRIIHLSPSSNHIDHGFYMFSPTFFYDYYSSNDWTILDAKVFIYTKRHNVDPWRIYNYEPGCLDRLSLGGFRRGEVVGIWFVASKTASSTSSNSPQQGGSRQLSSSARPKGSSQRRVVRITANLMKYPAIYPIARSVYRFVMRFRRYLDPVHRLFVPLRMPSLFAKY